MVSDIINLRCLLQVQGREAPEERLGDVSICPSTNLPTFIPTYSYIHIYIYIYIYIHTHTHTHMLIFDNLLLCAEIQNILRCFPDVGKYTFERTPGFCQVRSFK